MSPDSGSITTTSEAFRFPKLTGSNYAIWSQHMQAALQAKFLWLYVTGAEFEPDDPGPRPIAATSTPDLESKQTDRSAGSSAQATSPAPSITLVVPRDDYPERLKEWKAASKEWVVWSRNDQAAMGYMKNAAESSQWPHVAGAKTAKEMWDIWKDLYVTSQQQVSVHYHFEDLYTRKWDEKAPMADHIASMLDLHQKILAAGEEFPDVHVARAIILSLPRSSSLWEMVKQRCFSQPNLTLDFVTSELTSNYLRITKDSEALKKEEEAKQTQEKLALLTRSAAKPKKKRGGPKPEDEEGWTTI